MKKSPEMRTWEVSRIKGTPAAILFPAPIDDVSGTLLGQTLARLGVKI